MNKITVTTPLIPSLQSLTLHLEDIWSAKWLTNNGRYHQRLEKELCEHLGVEYISLFSNGTLALYCAIQAMDLTGEVITTPYSFVATSNAILLNQLDAVFVDIEDATYNLDADKIEQAITEKTTAILPVHVYGNPCNHQAIDALAKKHNLKVIYDAAHAFGVEKDGQSILNWGDMSILSFHATKAYSTIEGGAVICSSLEMKQKLDSLKNFGYESELHIGLLGTNAKMNEVQAAFGLESLKIVDNAIRVRKEITDVYRNGLKYVRGIKVIQDEPEVKYNYSYFPIFVDEKIYGLSRDALYESLMAENIYSRRYFYPLIPDFELYKDNPKVRVTNLSTAETTTRRVICLPLHHEVSVSQAKQIVELIANWADKN